jgi:hypothetical protein
LTPNFQYEAGNALPNDNPNIMTATVGRFNLDSMSAGGIKKRKRTKTANKKSKKRTRTAKRKTSKNKKQRKR